MSNRYPHLELRQGARWPAGRPGRDLLSRLNKVGRDLRRTITITSGDRNPREAYVARMDYLSGGNLAAMCCGNAGWHSWADCGRQPTSNHARGRAADCVLATRKKGSVNIGEVPAARKSLAKHGLCLPVGSGETWHVEVGTVWLS